MIELSPKQLIELGVRLFSAEGPPRAMLLAGPPGMAKTAVSKAIAKRLGWAWFGAHPVTEEPPDVRLPWVVDGEGKFLPMGVTKLITDPQGPPLVVSIEDIGQALPMQPVYMQMIQERSLGGELVRPNVRFVATTNRKQDKAASAGVISTVTNRVQVFGVSVDADCYAEWLLKESGIPGEAPATMASYVRFKPDCLLDSSKGANKDIEPFCSLRSLEAATWNIAAGLDSHAVIASSVGDSRGTEIVAFFRIRAELPNPKEILANPATAKVPKADRPDVLYALVGALAHHVSGKTMGALCEYVERIPPEFMVACIKDAQSQKPELRKTAPFTKWLMKHRGLLGEGEDEQK